MPKEKYRRIFLHQMEAISMFIIIAKRRMSVWKFGNITRMFSSYSWSIFSRLTRSEKSFASENVWWIITDMAFWTEDLWFTYSPNSFRISGTNHLLVIFTGIKLSWDVSGCNVVPEAKIHELPSPTEQSTIYREQNHCVHAVHARHHFWEKRRQLYLE